MTTTNSLIFTHLGDLHITRAIEPHYHDYLSIVAQLEMKCGSAPGFLILSSDKANNGLPGPYNLVATDPKRLSIPLHVVPGDHDMEPGTLNAFYTLLQA